MAYTLSDILQDVGAIITQDTTLPTGGDLAVQTQMVNQAISEWSNAYEWKQLRVNQFGPTIVASQTSIGLPINFKKLMSRPYRMDVSTDNDYEEVRPEDFYARTFWDVNNRFCLVGGNNVSGYYLQINPALPSGASLLFDYQAYPSLVSNTTDVVVVPSRSFVSKKVLAKLFEARADPRFPQFNSEAEDSLANMMENEAALSGAFSNQTRNQYTQTNFRIGQES